MGKRSKVLSGIILLFAVAAVSINSCVHAPYVLPVSKRTSDPEICFERDILPVFISKCTQSGCHGTQSGKGGYVLDNYNDIMRKGIVPGNIAASKIWESVAITTSGDNAMPRNASRLNLAQLDLLKRWIIAGAVDSGACNSSCDSNNISYSQAIAPMMQVYCVGCHNSASDPGGSLADYNSVYSAAVTGRMIGNITHQSGYNAMPPGYQLSDCQVAQVKKWVAAGALNN